MFMEKDGIKVASVWLSITAAIDKPRSVCHRIIGRTHHRGPEASNAKTSRVAA
jgi:hypothetical protein